MAPDEMTHTLSWGRPVRPGYILVPVGARCRTCRRLSVSDIAAPGPVGWICRRCRLATGKAHPDNP